MPMLTPMEESVYALAVQTGVWMISDDGAVWRVARRVGDRWNRTYRTIPCARVRAEFLSRHGYLRVTITVNYVKYSCMAHRLVWRHFYGPIPENITVNHKDGDKTNNALPNLELATHSEQMDHAVHVLKRPLGGPGRKRRRLKERNLTTAQRDEIRGRYESGARPRDIAMEYGITQGNARQVKSQMDHN